MFKKIKLNNTTKQTKKKPTQSASKCAGNSDI